MRRRWIVLVTVVLALAAAVTLAWTRRLRAFPETRDTDGALVEKWDNVIAYVPLDDRTDNLESTLYLAQASGYRVVMPERDWYRTALDGQSPNDNGTPYGNREALLEWVREMDRRGCDRFVLSLDQLFSGGLVHSRSVSEVWPLVFSDGVSLGEAEAFETYILPLSRDPNNRVYLFDSVVRLSPTVGYHGIGEAEYYGLREYGMVPRPETETLDLETVFSLYPYAADGVTRAEDALGSDRFRSTLTEERLREYWGVRRRKLTLLDRFLTSAASAENIQLLIGVDDSSNASNIQDNELRYLRQRLGPGAEIMAGLDSLARLLMGRLAQEEYGYRVKTSVRYIGGTEGNPSSEFDLYTLEQVVDLHLDFFRAKRVPEAEAELQIVVMTAPENPAQKAAYQEELLSLLESNLARRIPTVLNEASNNAYGDDLERALLDRIPFAGLVAFAGKYDQANVTGAAFAMGFSRYLYLKCRPEKDARCDAAQLMQLANSMALTEYILHTRTPLNQYAAELGVDTGNMAGISEEQARRIYRKLESLFLSDCRRVCRNLQETDLLSSLDPWGGRKIEEVEVTDFRFPWQRTFEIAFAVRATLASDGSVEKR